MRVFSTFQRLSIERRRTLYIFSIVFLLVLIVGKQVFIQFLMQKQKLEAQYITFLSRQRIICSQIVKGAYQYKENPATEQPFLKKVQHWHEVNLALLVGNMKINVPVPSVTAEYTALYPDVLVHDREVMAAVSMLKNKEEGAIALLLKTEDLYLEVLEKMVQIKGREAGKNYAKMAIIQVITDLLVVITLLCNLWLIMLPFVRLLMAKNKDLYLANEKLESVIESVSDMKFLLDTDGEIVLLNKTAKAGFSFFIGKNLQAKDNLIDMMGSEKFHHFFCEALKGNTIVAEKRFLKNEATYWYRIEYHPVWSQEKEVINVALSLTDISDLKNAQVILEHQNKELQEIARMQSHELRGPLASIMGLVSLFNNHYPNDEFNQDLIKNLKISSQNLDNVIFKLIAKAEKFDPLVTQKIKEV